MLGKEGEGRKGRPPAVSVLMTVYNGELYLAEAIRSILGQTLQDFEFIIIDNGSTDGSRAVVSRFRDSRIRFEANRTNVGPPTALNIGLRMAKGLLIARMDADDVALPDRLERQVRFLEENPECVAVGTQIRMIDHAGRFLYAPLLPTAPHEMLWKLVFTSPLAHSSVMLRRDAVLSAGGYDERFRYTPDYDLWSRLIGQGHRLSNLRELLTFIRIHGTADGMTAVQAELIDEVASISARNIQVVLGLRMPPDETRKMILLVNYHQGSSRDALAALRTLDTVAGACAAAFGREMMPCYGRTLMRLAVSPGRIPGLGRVGLFVKGVRLVLAGTDNRDRFRFVKDWVLTGRFVGAVRLAWRRSSLRGSRVG